MACAAPSRSRASGPGSNPRIQSPVASRRAGVVTPRKGATPFM